MRFVLNGIITVHSPVKIQHFVSFISHIICFYQAGLCSGSAVHLYLGGAQFISGPGYWLFCL